MDIRLLRKLRLRSRFYVRAGRKRLARKGRFQLRQAQDGQPGNRRTISRKSTTTG